MDAGINYSTSALRETKLMVSFLENSKHLKSDSFHGHPRNPIRANSNAVSFVNLSVRSHHSFVWLPQGTVHSFHCFITDLNGASFLLDFKFLRTKPMPSLYHDIEGGGRGQYWSELLSEEYYLYYGECLGKSRVSDVGLDPHPSLFPTIQGPLC